MRYVECEGKLPCAWRKVLGCEKSLVCWRTGWSPCRDVLSKIFYAETSVQWIRLVWSMKCEDFRNWSSSFCLCVAWRIVVGCFIYSSNGREIVHWPIGNVDSKSKKWTFYSVSRCVFCVVLRRSLPIRGKRESSRTISDARQEENGATRSTTGKSDVRWCWERRIFSIF